MVLCTFPILCAKKKTKKKKNPIIKLRHTLIFSSPDSCTQDLCICINVKNDDNEGGVFCLFLMDIAMGGGFRLI